VLRAGDPFLDALHHEARRADAHPYATEALAAMRSYEIAYTERRRPLLDASRTTSPRRPDPSSTEAPAPAILSELTPREAEVFEQLALGGSYGDIGRALFVTENTVKTHLASIYRKLGVERRAEALQVGRDRGLLGASAPVPRPRQ
jgi:DNA-binding NarL/FixJ family response regulator